MAAGIPAANTDAKRQRAALALVQTATATAIRAATALTAEARRLAS
jgi:hypothetical protein